jgi:hypothetical protein
VSKLSPPALAQVTVSANASDAELAREIAAAVRLLFLSNAPCPQPAPRSSASKSVRSGSAALATAYLLDPPFFPSRMSPVRPRESSSSTTGAAATAAAAL